MPYRPLPPADTRDREIQRVFKHANNYLADVYTMLGAQPSPESNGGKCNFSVALVLACVIDGLATEIDPIEPVGDALVRMGTLLERIKWGRKSDGWITKHEATKVLYTDIRNSLVHNLGADKRTKVRRPRFSDPAIVHRMIDRSVPSVDDIDAIEAWNPKWPIIWEKPKNDPGKRLLILSTYALYWHVKKIAADLATDKAILENALANRKCMRVR